MCGIAGIVSLHGGSIDTSPMPGMLHVLRHRGPDDEGTHFETGVALGHRRLSVIDVAGGHQPLRGSRPGTVAVVNGEIYNYRELARELRSRGSVFRTASDSEVVAHAYDAWGLDFLDRLDGMFALAVWDRQARRLVLARDRLGEKPLYHTIAAGSLIFGSELSAVLAHPDVAFDIDPVSLREYLTFEYVPAPRTIVRDVSKLEPGTALVLEHGSTRIVRYWSIDARPHSNPPAYRDAVAELRSRIDTAVASRLVSDVPLGVFLSGGIDSSTMAAFAARHGALETFAIGFDEPSFDERHHARTVADYIGSHHHEYVVSPAEMPDMVPNLGTLLDEPIGDASIVPTAILSRFARQHVTVALGGDGGDELFGGYPMHQGHRVAALARFAPDLLLHGMSSIADRIPVGHGNFTLGFKARTFLRGAKAVAPANHVLWMSSFPPAEHAAVLSGDVLAGAASADPIQAAHRWWGESHGASTLARAMHLDANMYLPNDVLTKVDRASMAFALEVRAPFLARDVVEFAFSLPASYRMRGLTGKRILRDAVRSMLPSETIHRKKKGFGMPVAAWLNGSLKELVHDVLSADALASAGIFRPDGVARLLSEHTHLVRDHRKPLWTLLMFELWRHANEQALSRQSLLVNGS